MADSKADGTAAGRDSGSQSSLLGTLNVGGAARLHEAVPVPMRDGVLLDATLVVPNEASAESRRPVILIQTPYSPGNELGIGLQKDVLSRLIREGYVVAIVNDRGTQWSEGEYHWLKSARNDGLDTLQWITGQPWSNGNVGTIGCSSSGEVQLPLATANPPALKAVVAMGAATGVGVIPGFSDQGIFYMGGVPSFDWAWWYHGNGYHHHPKFPRDISLQERAALTHAFEPDARYRTEDLSWATHLPSGTLLDAIGSPETEFNTLISLAPDNPLWKSYDFVNSGDQTRVPILHIDSWYDTIEVYGTTKLYEYLAKNSPNQHLVIGGTGHCRQGSETAQTIVGQRPIGDARLDYIEMIVKWFDHWLKNDGQGELALPNVKYYSLESNRWSSSATWPVSSKAWPLHLSGGGKANSLTGDGQLREVRQGPLHEDQLLDDPLNPVPTLGGGCCTDQVSLDQTEIENRMDVLVYTTPPLPSDRDIVGYINATLYLSSSAPDGDVMVKLVDVYPDGKAYNITDTAQRLRYRDGIAHVALMTPGQIYKVTLGQMVVASHFAAGHRIRLEIAGTNFPEYERNLHTGGRNFDEDHPAAAHLTVYHDPAHDSRLELPLVSQRAGGQRVSR